MSSKDKDFEYKHRFQKVLWKMGFWTRIEVPVLAYSIDTYIDNLKKHDLTDIDVYGEHINLDFSINKYITDCKSGRNVKNTERVFWLRGVMDYTQANKGFLVKKGISSNIRLILDKLNIYAIDNTNLNELEKLYDTKEISEVFSVEYYQEREKIVNSLSVEYKKIYQFLSQRYWYNPSHLNLAVLLTMLRKGEFYRKFSQDDKTHLFLLLEIVILLSRILFECCNYVLHRNIADIPQAVLEFTHGGVNGLNNKKNIIREVQNIIIKLYPDENVKVDDNEIKPFYYKSLTELIATLLTEPAMSKDIIRYLEIFQHEIITGKSYDLQNIFGATFSNVTLKLSKDIVRFYASATKVDQSIFKSILNK
ncbi:hypothetical protein [Fictibacillus gelatini]|uniref:hypothetical protein n=1 Tax=Fictibacillus gelatini TaxID=225985 RepID=UPI0004134A84|nr:hypothetical protein [Fictibacillus gelatini]